MDLGSIVAGVLAVNVGVFLGGCALAVYRTWRESHPFRRRPVPRPIQAHRPTR